MASVYLAHGRTRSGLHRFVAIKIIRADLAASAQFVDMFVDEAFVATQIHHPNVCDVLEYGQHHGTHFLVMELLSGQTLTAVQRELSGYSTDALGVDLRAGILARVLEGACEGLHAAHEAVDARGKPLHVVHRDVSPDNLFVGYDGTVKVMDFGVAYTSGQHHHTRTGVVKGKCSYLAPEIVAGNKPDRRADVWGIGVVAWELLARRKLFDQPSDPAILNAIYSAEIPPPSSLCPGLPAAFDAVVLKALERDPTKRYENARELGRALNRCIVEQRWLVGPAEIAECMRALYPEGVTTARQQLQFAEQLEAPPPSRTRTPIPVPDEPTVANPEVMQALARESAPPEAVPTPLPAMPTERVTSRFRAPRWLLTAAIVVLSAVAGAVVACRNANEPAMPVAGFTLQATPAGVDASGAVLLRVQVVPTR
jgi:serine/threonine-protein kinase